MTELSVCIKKWCVFHQETFNCLPNQTLLLNVYTCFPINIFLDCLSYITRYTTIEDPLCCLVESLFLLIYVFVSLIQAHCNWSAGFWLLTYGNFDKWIYVFINLYISLRRLSFMWYLITSFELVVALKMLLHSITSIWSSLLRLLRPFSVCMKPIEVPILVMKMKLNSVLFMCCFIFAQIANRWLISIL